MIGQRPPKRGSFDYLLGPIINPPVPPPPRGGNPGDGGTVRIEIEIIDARAQARKLRKERFQRRQAIASLLFIIGMLWMLFR